MKKENFGYVQRFIKEQSGLILSEEKGYLIESRLMPLVRKRGLGGLDELIAKLRDDGDKELMVDVTEAMTTNESLFFRDVKPFDAFREAVLPQIVAARKEANATKIRIWSAACSSGQEPYSLAMILMENPQLLQGLKAEIFATDISGQIIKKARLGFYTQFEAQRGLPVQMLMKYFTQVDENWQIHDSIRDMVTFAQINLLENMSMLAKFDIVFLRNVLIYFDQPTKAEVLYRIGSVMPDDGILYLGGAESLLGICDTFKPMPEQRGIYVVNRSAHGTVVPKKTVSSPAPSAPLVRTA